MTVKKINYKDYSIVSFIGDVYGIECKKVGRNYTAQITGTKGYDTTIFEQDCKFKNWTTGTAGNIFDLIQLIENCDFQTAKNKVLQWSGTYSHTPIIDTSDNNQQHNINIYQSFHPSLIQYANSRGITKNTLIKYCVQVNIGKYFHIGFQNDKNGYCLRNKLTKRNTGKATISTIKGNSQTVNIFEGFFDFLTYKEVYPNCQYTCIVINSTAHLTKKVLKKLLSFETIQCWLDNDDAGKEAIKKIKNISATPATLTATSATNTAITPAIPAILTATPTIHIATTVKDMSYKYAKYNDLNSFYMEWLKHSNN